MRRSLFALAAVVLALAGCGGSAVQSSAPAESEHVWVKGALLLIEGLDEALASITNAGVGEATLTSTSALYEALLGYTYLGGCGEVLTNLGEPTPRLRPVRDDLALACRRVEHASTVFTRAVQEQDAKLLAAAAREALGTKGLIERARAALASRAAVVPST
jgi:hypothetical protein